MTKEQEEPVIVSEIPRLSRALFPTGGLSVSTIGKALLESSELVNGSNLGRRQGEQAHPIDFGKTTQLLNHNTHHATALRTKRDALVGLGFETEYDKKLRVWKANPMGSEMPVPNPAEVSKAQEILDPLTLSGLCDLLLELGESFESTANAYMEVVRVGDEITYIGHLPTEQVTVFLETANNNIHFHYLIRTDGSGGKNEVRFCRFGDKERFLATDFGKDRKSDEVSEIIHFREPTAQSPHYGIPHWLPVVPAIELVQMIHQQQFDFFLNRGVPEFMALFLGKKLPKETWERIEEAMRATIGQGNQHKSIALNIVDPDLKVQIEKLNIEGAGDDRLTEKLDALAMEIVSGHRVPPLLAGIMVPGKMGATNELPNALLAFQTLFVDHRQNIFTSTLGNTLGDKEKSGLALSREDFILRKITDRFDLQQMDTMSRMRETVPEAEASGRDLEDGLKKSYDTITPEQAGQLLGKLLMKMVESEAA